MIRSDTDKAIVEGEFQIPKVSSIEKFLIENGYDFNQNLIIRREINSKGVNRIFVNDTPATQQIIKTLGNLVADLHGQHEHQSLLNPETHIGFLDEFGHFVPQVETVRTAFEKVNQFQNELKDLRSRQNSLQEKREMYEFQLKEINLINPQLGEEENLIAEEKILANSEQLASLTQKIYQELYEGEKSVGALLKSAGHSLEELEQIDASFKDLKVLIDSAQAEVGEVTKAIQKYHSKIEYNPARLEEIRERLSGFQKLKKKYGGSIEAVFEHKKKIEKDLNLSGNFDLEIQKIEHQIQDAQKDFTGKAITLSRERQTLAKKLEQIIISNLNELGMDKARFEVKISQEPRDVGWVQWNQQTVQAFANGIDLVEFYIQPNVGEELRPLVKIASGGEISRVMLALKVSLAAADKIPTLIFDEIDIGISGRIAQAVGKNLRKLANDHQTICITHLPQIASCGEHHFSVEKKVEGGRTVTRIRPLTPRERIQEIAKLLGGEKITDVALKNAEELLALSKT
jgi:DNA repair protein RecN (Recombination protein N)